MFALSYGSWNQLNLAECSSSLNTLTVGAAERKAGFIRVYSPNEQLGVQLAVSCRAPLRGCRLLSPRPQPPLEPLLLRELQRPSQRPAELIFLFLGGCLIERTELGPLCPRGLPRCRRPRPPFRGAVSAARPAPLSPQRYLKGLVDISRVGWAVWVGFPVLEVSCSRPSLVPPSRPGPALPAPEGPASSRLPPLGLDLHSDV